MHKFNNGQVFFNPNCFHAGKEESDFLINGQTNIDQPGSNQLGQEGKITFLKFQLGVLS